MTDKYPSESDPKDWQTPDMSEFEADLAGSSGTASDAEVGSDAGGSGTDAAGAVGASSASGAGEDDTAGGDAGAASPSAGLAAEEEDGQTPADTPADPEDELAKAQDDLARVRAELYNLNQQYTNYVRRAKAGAAAQRQAGQVDVCEALLGVLDDIEAARQHGDLETGPLAAIATKLEEVLNLRFGLEKFGENGEEFDPNRHEALMASTSTEVSHPVIKTVIQPGYQVKDKVLRAAKVAVENPE